MDRDRAGRIAAWASGAIALLLVSGLAIAQSYSSRSRMSAPVTGVNDPAAGWTSNGTTASTTQLVSGTQSFTSTVASGSNAFAVATSGARIDFGAGASDYASSDGTTVTFAGPINSTAFGTSAAQSYMPGGAAVPTNKAYYFNGPTTLNKYIWSPTASGIVEIDAFDNTVVVTSDTTTPAKPAFRITPQDAQPSGAVVVGDVYVTTAGVMKICTVAGTGGGATWVSVGAQ